MKSFEHTVFAVVDLETTGTQREENNHIIQFGCAIIKNMKVVKTYSFMITSPTENFCRSFLDTIKSFTTTTTTTKWKHVNHT